MKKSDSLFNSFPIPRFNFCGPIFEPIFQSNFSTQIGIFILFSYSGGEFQGGPKWLQDGLIFWTAELQFKTVWQRSLCGPKNCAILGQERKRERVSDSALARERERDSQSESERARARERERERESARARERERQSESKKARTRENESESERARERDRASESE